MGQQETVATSLADTVREGIGAALAQVDADLARRYPGDPGTRQPVHTVYVPGDVFAAGTLRSWGTRRSPLSTRTPPTPVRSPPSSASPTHSPWTSTTASAPS